MLQLSSSHLSSSSTPQNPPLLELLESTQFTNAAAIALVLYAIARNLLAASLKPLWYDEILTLTVSMQRTWPNIINALYQGTDGQPPLYYVLEHFSLLLPLRREIALRLPSILAFPCAMSFVYLYAKRAAGGFIALICAFFLLMTDAFQNYATQARPYALMVACFAAALLCYQQISRPLMPVAMAVALVLAESFHYYAIFSAVPFVIAELIYLLLQRRVRWSVWAAISCVLLPMLLAWHLLTNFKTIYGGHFWAHYSLFSLPYTYGSLFFNDPAIGVVLGTLLAGVIVYQKLIRGTDSDSNCDLPDAAEGTLLLAFLFLPLTTFAATKVLGGSMLERYVLCAVLGLALAISCLRRSQRTWLVMALAYIGLMVGAREFSFWRHLNAMSVSKSTAESERFITQAGHSELPVVVADGLTFLPLALYGPPQLTERIAYAMDEQKALQFTQSDSVEKNFVPLRQYWPVAIPDWEAFSAANSEFLLFTEKPISQFDWLPVYLPKVSSLKLLNENEEHRLYLVKMRPQN
jgi:hypothetical protein